MTKRTVKDLATEAGLDADEALVTLWDAGIESVLRASDPVPAGQLSRARSALGLANSRTLNSIQYWLNRLDMDHSELAGLVAEHGLQISSGARTLPKGGVAVMRKFERQGDRVILKESVKATLLKDGESPETPPPFAWRTIGKVRDLRFLTALEIEAIHDQLFEDFLASDNPIDTPGMRSADLLESACSRPQTSHGGTLKYPSAELAASALAHSVVNNHPFWNGNKRTALVSYLVFLDEHGLTPTCADDELFRFILRVSQHRLVPRDWPDRADREVLAMAEWTKGSTRAIVRGERMIKWHRLRRVLASYDCRCEVSKNVGNRMHVYRDVSVRGPLGVGRRRKTLHIQVTYADEGREADRNAIRELRAGLQLDEEHGVDSSAFYDGEPRTAGDFILEYRRILRRLARL
jgi:death-on-curing family protein